MGDDEAVATILALARLLGSVGEELDWRIPIDIPSDPTRTHAHAHQKRPLTYVGQSLISICLADTSILFDRPLISIGQTPHFFWPGPSLLLARPLTSIGQPPLFYWPDPSLLLANPFTSPRQNPHFHIGQMSHFYLPDILSLGVSSWTNPHAGTTKEK